MGKRMARGGGGLLFGRRTYEDLYEVWPKRNDGNPYTEVLNRTKKYVASRTLNDPLPWANSVLLRGDAVDAVVELKAAGGEDLGATSSTSTFSPFTPLVLGTGQR